MRLYCSFFLAVGLVAQALAQRPVEVAINEPGVYELGALYKRADAVALAEIVAGDTEGYDKVVYKAKVIVGYKGLHAGEIFYFGPFLGTRLGTRYLLFLLDTHKTLQRKAGEVAAYGAVHYWEVFDEGYSSMEVSYQCVFPGRKPAENCDDGVRVCTDYITLPNSLPAFPPEEGHSPFGCRWVRKNRMNSFLDKLATSR